MEDEAARPLRSSEQLEARMCELKRLVASELLSSDDVAVEVAQLRAEARAWLLRTAAAGVQPGGAAAPLPPPAPPAPAPAPALAATTESVPARSAMSAMPSLDASLVGKSVAVRMVDIGWCAGEVVRRSSSGTVLSYNYVVRYDADDEQQHWLTEPRYVGSNVASAENDWMRIRQAPFAPAT